VSFRGWKNPDVAGCNGIEGIWTATPSPFFICTEPSIPCYATDRVSSKPIVAKSGMRRCNVGPVAGSGRLQESGGNTSLGPGISSYRNHEKPKNHGLYSLFR
jgi:hypothetical protein